ncbi:MAG: hypothetical protein AAB768_00780 [Patescibacteria group bacterium]
MVSISGIKDQKTLEKMPYLNKSQLQLLVGKEGKNLDKKLEQLKKMGYLRPIKNNLYVTDAFFGKNDRGFYTEYMANNLRAPSYISLEYVLAREGLIPEAVYATTSITSKTSRDFQNFLGTFIYRNIKSSLFRGYKQVLWEGRIINIAGKAKALFDFLYLKKMLNLKTEITTDLRINWDNFGSEDLLEFTDYVLISKSKKMLRILNIIKKYVSQ